MSNNTTTSTKLRIPHPAEPDCAIVGILEQHSPSSPTQGRKLALILHGTMGGNHETAGTWRQGAMMDDLVDLMVVVDYLKSTYGYVIDLVVGHSRGAMTAIRWICTTDEESPAADAWKASFKERGYYDWKVTVARKPVTVKIFPEDLETTAKWDTSIIWDRFPPNVDVLTLHGLADGTVPPYDAMIFARAFSGRTPGTHVLNMIEDADHNYTGRQNEVVSAILDWWAARERGELKTSVWVEQEALRARL
ncbi:hypothetical protein C0989_000138 [Termitomyces sp. Mn162]|nr:hypothetical protein C0989_000138 [Termitomyces sp. Mn162]